MHPQVGGAGAGAAAGHRDTAATLRTPAAHARSGRGWRAAFSLPRPCLCRHPRPRAVQEDETPVPSTALGGYRLVFDAVYTPLHTRLLRCGTPEDPAPIALLHGGGPAALLALRLAGLAARRCPAPYRRTPSISVQGRGGGGVRCGHGGHHVCGAGGRPVPAVHRGGGACGADEKRGPGQPEAVAAAPGAGATHAAAAHPVMPRSCSVDAAALRSGAKSAIHPFGTTRRTARQSAGGEAGKKTVRCVLGEDRIRGQIGGGPSAAGVQQNFVCTLHSVAAATARYACLAQAALKASVMRGGVGSLSKLPISWYSSTPGPSSTRRNTCEAGEWGGEALAQLLLAPARLQAAHSVQGRGLQPLGVFKPTRTQLAACRPPLPSHTLPVPHPCPPPMARRARASAPP